MEKVKEHNQVVEDHYINNELSKLRSQFQKQRLIDKVKPPKVNLDPDMSEIIRSSQSSASSVRDFYTAPIDALEHMETSVAMMDTKTIQSIVLPSLGDEDSSSSIFSAKNLEITVHFEENVDDTGSESSSLRTPNDHEIDSAISYLADKVLDQIEAEAKLELVEEKFQQLKLTGTHICDEPDESLTVTKIVKEEIQEIKNDDEEDDSDECVSSTTETNSLVQKLFIQRFPPDRVLIQKYFLKWIHYTTIQKIEKENISSNPSQISKINSFLDKIRHEKSRIAREKPVGQGHETRMENVVMTKKYRNK